MNIIFSLIVFVSAAIVIFVFFSAIRKMYMTISKLRRSVFELETSVAELTAQLNEDADDILVLKTALYEAELISEDAIYDIERRIIEMPRAQTKYSPSIDNQMETIDDEDPPILPPHSKNIH